MNLSRFLENFLRREDPGSTSGTAKLFRSTSRGRSPELDFAEIHHRSLTPGDILGDRPVFIDSSNLALSFKERDSRHVPVNVDLTPQNGQVYPKMFESKRFPVIAFSTDKSSKSPPQLFYPS